MYIETKCKTQPVLSILYLTRCHGTDAPGIVCNSKQETLTLPEHLVSPGIFVYSGVCNCSLGDSYKFAAHHLDIDTVYCIDSSSIFIQIGSQLFHNLF